MDYVLRCRYLFCPVKNAFRIYKKSHGRVKRLKRQKKVLKDCYDNHILSPSIDVKLKNSTKSFPPARKLTQEGNLKSAKN